MEMQYMLNRGEAMMLLVLFIFQLPEHYMYKLQMQANNWYKVTATDVD